MSSVTVIKANVETVDYDQLVARDLASLMDLIEGRAFEDLKAPGNCGQRLALCHPR